MLRSPPTRRRKFPGRKSLQHASKRRVCLYSCMSLLLFAFSLVVALILRTLTKGRKHNGTLDISSKEKTVTTLAISPWNSSAPIANLSSVTAILPVSSRSLKSLEFNLDSLADASQRLSEVIIACPDSILPETRRVVRSILTNSRNDLHPELSIWPWQNGTGEIVGMMLAALQAVTEYVLFLEETGLTGLDFPTKHLLLFPRSTSIALGPRGVLVQHNRSTCLTPSNSPQAASYLIPPFVIPSSLFRLVGPNARFLDGWLGLGRLMSKTRADAAGGMVIGFRNEPVDWCATSRDRNTSIHDEDLVSPDGLYQDSTTLQHGSYHAVTSPALHPDSAVFAILFPSLRDLGLFSQVACRLRNKGHTIRILLYDEIDDGSSEVQSKPPTLSECGLHYDTVTEEDFLAISDTVRREDLMIADWMDTWDNDPDVLIALADQDALTSSLDFTLQEIGLGKITMVRVPRADLFYSDWMGSLSLREWSNFNVPRIELSVITNNRPRSLRRLLSSVSQSRFFGDRVNIRVNLEHSSDAETMQIVDNFQWPHGELFTHRRIIQGGLLPAVVESWYPHSNDSYGLLLEDDIEVSPLFYAWTKMAVLRYRYGEDMNKSPQLFGISLYQQKNVELHPDGRHPFNAQKLFSENDLQFPFTPYLSQIPCSWGAVYFPEHWREFHKYLSQRLSGSWLPSSHVVVPNVRSNRWKKSWKKFFIELAFLKGYVMLYPNYDGFVSLSTNHLEAGSHVKEVSKEKRDLFLLPLMQLPVAGQLPSVTLMDLPNGELPAWDALPVLNLTGSMSSMESIKQVGDRRWMELTMCSRRSLISDPRGFMCVVDSAKAVKREGIAETSMSL